MLADIFDPSSWATLVEKIGVAPFFVLLFALFIGYLLLRALQCTVGESGFVRRGVEELFALGKGLVEDLRAGVKDLQQRSADQAAVCQREVVSTEQLREAGGHFAELGRAIGRAVNADVDEHVNAITRTLARPA